ncbi:MAG TPA: host attachment protein [Chloroflexi bacterium]|nr:host attachment protein [Chloroflexota bacterium]
MNQYCVVVVDGARARFFRLEEAEIPELESSPRLVELEDMVNPEKELPDGELWTEAKTGRNRAPNGGPAHGYDDHRSQHTDEIERRFAHEIANHCASLSERMRAKEVILASEKRMLGFLRQAMQSRLRDVNTRELAKDISKLASMEIHDYLAREGLLPRRKRPGG